MEFTEKDASAFGRLREEKKAQVCETRRSLEKRSRHLMDQSALLKHDIDTFKNQLGTIGIHDYLTGVAHVCECAPLCPAVWSMLPVELLQRVFAGLPLRDIIRLRVLSKTWDRDVTGVTPGFTKLCAERNPNMFALVREAYELMGINLYDSKEKRWHQFEQKPDVFLTSHTRRVMEGVGDGGLVCFVSSAQDKEMEIAVFNPLTRQGRKLPSSSSLTGIQPRMVQLVMDRDSKCYKVLVVGPKEESGGDALAWIFSSVTGKWSKPDIFSDLIFGFQYSWKSYGPGNGFVHMIGYNLKKVGPCAYDCASSTLLELDDVDGVYSDEVRGVLVKDRGFVLYWDEEYFLTEYQAQSFQPNWVELKVHKCLELDEVSSDPEDLEHARFKTRVFGCQDLLVVTSYDVSEVDCLHEITLLFDLSTSQWQIISEIPEWSPHDALHDHMFELRWDAVP